MSDLFYVNDVSPAFPEWLKILNILEDKNVPEIEIAQDAWTHARMGVILPHLGNILQSVVLDRIRYAFGQKYPDDKCEYYVNALDNHLYINDYECQSVEAFTDIIQHFLYL